VRELLLYTLSLIMPHAIWYCGFTVISVEKIQVCLKSCRNVGHLTWRPKYILLFSAAFNRHKSILCFSNGSQLLVIPSVRLSSCISMALTEQICVKFDTGNFYENLSTNSKFCYIQLKYETIIGPN
jgi:hypothetical protein